MSATTRPAPCATAGLPSSAYAQRATAPARGFTLVELLVVIMILGILASLTTFALWDAQTEARAARTRTQIQKIHELLMIRWESYQTRPVPVRTSRLPPEFAAKARLNAIRALMRMEMPDRITDVTDDPGPVLEAPNGAVLATMGTPSLALGYRRRVAANGGISSWSATNQQAECLYMILASIQDGTRNGLDFFRESEIGDTDGDGMPEILDGWGQPIRFLRWAPGYISDVQNRADLQPDPFDPMRIDPRWKNNRADDRHFPSDQTPPYPDPAGGTYDPTLDDPVQLFPLVFSAGPDGFYHVLLDRYTLGNVNGNGVLAEDDYSITGEYNGESSLVHYRNTHATEYADYTPPIPTYPPKAPWPTRDIDGPGSNTFPLWISSPRNDPYLLLPNAEVPPSLGGSGAGVTIGTRYGEGANDNIDNQSLLVR